MSAKYIGFLDILGFKDLVFNNSHEDLVKIFQNLFCLNVESSIAGGKFKVVKTEHKTFSVADLDSAKVNSIVISDSVIFWTDDDGMQSFINICVTIMQLIISGVFTGFPIRGAITIGDLSIVQNNYGTIKNNSLQSIVGRGLVDSYMLEAKQNWIGCIVDDKCISRYQELCKTFAHIDDLATLDYLIKSGILCEYQVPFKSGKREKHYVINWVKGNKTPPSDETVEKSFSMHNKSASSFDVQCKIDNTLEFLKYVVVNT